MKEKAFKKITLLLVVLFLMFGTMMPNKSWVQATSGNTAPEVISIKRSEPVDEKTNATSVTYLVTFSESVTGVGLDDFSLTKTGTASGTIEGGSGSGTTYLVTVTITGVGTLRLDLNHTGTGITDEGGLAAAGYTAGQVYSVGVVGLPTITTHPSNQTITAGGNATFTVAATGDVPLSYQWKKDGVNIPGATSADLIFNPVQASDAGNYTVVVTNAVGNDTSNVATLTVTPAPVAPTITTQPSNQTITAGDNAKFTVVASGDAPLSYQWEKDGVNIQGATSANLTVNNVQASDVGNYTVVVTNAVGNVTSNTAILTVTPAPVAPRPSAPSVTADDVNNTILGITELMEYKLANGDWTTYDTKIPPDLSGNKTVIVRVKATVNTPAGEEIVLTFTAPTSSGGGGGSTTVSPLEPIPTPQSTTDQIVADVDGNDDQNLVKILISRTTESNGTVKDKVNLSYSIVKELVEKAKEQGVDTARIIIPDKEDIVSEIQVEIPKAALEELNKGNLKLEIVTPNAVISIPTTSIDNFNEDLYFRIVPIKSENEKEQVENRVQNETLIQETIGNNTIQVLGRPMEIETNLQGRQVSIVLPLTASLPTNPSEREKVLNNLRVFIEHSDGTKELIQGTVVKMKDGSEGLEFKVNKFSTFTIVYLEDWQGEVAEEVTSTPEEVTHTPYVKGYSNNEFRPNALVTRAQMATMLARNLEVPLSTAVYADVKPSHGAFNYVMEVKAAGIMTGVNPTTFNLNGNVTRAQMATIVYRWIQKQCEKDPSDDANCVKLSNISETSFKDVTNKHGAAEAINFTKAAGIMVGFEDNTFKPNQALTRAQAVKVINIFFKRGPLTNVEAPTFKDVPKTHWAFGEVEEAAREHEIILDANR